MKNFWNWVLGIVVILLVLFALGIGGRLLTAKLYPVSVGNFDGFHMPMMGGRGVFGFGMPHGSFGFMGAGWLIPLALVGLVIYGVYRLGVRNSQNSAPPAVISAPAPVRTCVKCGSIVQEGWKHCANCGHKQ